MLRFLIRLAVLPVRMFAFFVRVVTLPLKILSFLKSPKRFIARALLRKLLGRKRILA